jgi:hypothetical protein
LEIQGPFFIARSKAGLFELNLKVIDLVATTLYYTTLYDSTSDAYNGGDFHVHVKVIRISQTSRTTVTTVTSSNATLGNTTKVTRSTEDINITKNFIVQGSGSIAATLFPRWGSLNTSHKEKATLSRVVFSF